MKKNLNISNEELINIDYKHTHILKKFTNDNGKIIDVRYFKIKSDLIFSNMTQLQKNFSFKNFYCTLFPIRK